MKKKNFKLLNYVFVTIFLMIPSIVFADETISCGESIMEIPLGAAQIMHAGYLLIKIAAPVVLVFMGSIDLIKAVIGADESEIKKNQIKFGKRIVSALMVFLVMSIIQLVFHFLAQSGFSGPTDCVNTILNGKY